MRIKRSMCSSILYKDSVFLLVNIQYNPEPDFYRYPLCINNVSAQRIILPSSKRNMKNRITVRLAKASPGNIKALKKKASPFFGLPVDAVDPLTYE